MHGQIELFALTFSETPRMRRPIEVLLGGTIAAQKTGISV